jgi:hypothetical protein
MVDTSEKFRWLVRLGYAARGVVYLVFGYLALTTANQARDGGTAVFDLLRDVPLGTLVLWLMALGLLAYALFKFISAIGDVQHHGSDPKGLMKRVGEGASAIAHTILAFAAYQYATGSSGGSSSGSEGSQQAAGSILEMPLGELVIGVVGLGFLVGAFMQAKSAVTAAFMKHVGGGAPSAVEPIGRLGYAARAAVFAIIGWSLVRSAWLDSEAEVKGLGDALLSLRDSGALYTAVAIGLLLFGMLSLVVARWRIIPDVHSSDLRPSLR